MTATVNFTPQGFARILSADPSASAHSVSWVTDKASITYPFKARFTGYSARVLLRCKVGPAGVLSECAEAEETPRGFGFAAAAVATAKGSKVAAKTVDGLATQGMTVEIVVTANPSCDNKPAWDRQIDGCSPGSQPYQRRRVPDPLRPVMRRGWGCGLSA